MKKILIVSHAMELGGVERSLLGLLETLDPQKVQTDLFLLRHEGELMDYIPEHVNLLPEIPAYTVLARPMKDTLREGHVLLTASRFVGRYKAKRYCRKHEHSDSGTPLEYSHKYTKWLMPAINPNVEYDLAISFLTPHYFVAERVKAKKKIAWVHTDYTQIQINTESEVKVWEKYDYIAAVSENVKQAFLKTFPRIQTPVIVVENILPSSFIDQQSEQPIDATEMSNGAVKLLSVGRFCTAKNFDNVPEICRKMIECGLDVIWYLIGFGPDEKLIRQRINDFEMKDKVIILGKKTNPYPYIKKCDAYIQPSRYEGKSVSVREAQMLGKPVIITAFPTANSQLDDGKNGLVVPLETTTCADRLSKILKDHQILESVSKECKREDFSNREEVEKIYRILDEIK